MTVTDRARRARRIAAVAALGAGTIFGLAACGGAPETDAVSESAPASVGVADTDRVRLTEGMLHTLAPPSPDPVVVQIVGYESGEEPAVVLEVRREKSTERHTLRLGESVEIAGGSWRVSEIGVSDSEPVPGSATLVRDGATGEGEGNRATPGDGAP